MLEKYINKEVKIVTAIFGTTVYDIEKGIITAIDDNFIELNNKILISKQHVYRITLR